jgi:hypothetical protein
MSVRFSDPIHQIVGYQRSSANPLEEWLAARVGSAELPRFMRLSLRHMRGVGTEPLPESYPDVWMGVIEALEMKEIDEDIHVLIEEIWPWIPPPNGCNKWEIGHLKTILP